jgi:hypothetical protein
MKKTKIIHILILLENKCDENEIQINTLLSSFELYPISQDIEIVHVQLGEKYRILTNRVNSLQHRLNNLNVKLNYLLKNSYNNKFSFSSNLSLNELFLNNFDDIQDYFDSLDDLLDEQQGMIHFLLLHLIKLILF